MNTHIYHHDIEAHAQSFNEGYATAMAHQQGVDVSESISAADISHSHLGMQATIAREGFRLTDTLRGVSHEVEVTEGGGVGKTRTHLTFVNAGSVLTDGNSEVLLEVATK